MSSTLKVLTDRDNYCELPVCERLRPWLDAPAVAMCHAMDDDQVDFEDDPNARVLILRGRKIQLSASRPGMAIFSCGGLLARLPDQEGDECCIRLRVEDG